MRITNYSFGSITIDGTTYRTDVIIYPDRVESSWWRKEGHSLSIDDLKDVISAKPETLIIGTGAYGVMNVPESTIKYLKAKGISIYIARTEEAIKIFNSSKGRTIACLHLTC